MMGAAIVDERERTVIWRQPSSLGPQGGSRKRIWAELLILALPFLVGVAVLKGLTVEVRTFHGTDAANYHLPTIRLFADHLQLSEYPAAQTPLFHILFAYYGKIVGFALWKLRLLAVIISYAAVLALFRLLLRSTRLRRIQALILSLLFALSPYFFGASFTLLTDNLAILFALIALERFYSFDKSERAHCFVLGCIVMSAAILTRQSFIWVAAVGVLYLLRVKRPLGVKIGLAISAALSLAPPIGLFLVWGNLVPPSSDPSSCGLCGSGSLIDSLSLKGVGVTLALIGLYGGVLVAPAIVRCAVRAVQTRAQLFDGTRLRRRLEVSSPVFIAIAAGLIFVVTSALKYDAHSDAGYLWKLSDSFPSFASRSSLFLLLVPIGCAFVYLLLAEARFPFLQSSYLTAFLISTLPIGLAYQKYFDPFSLIAVGMLVQRKHLQTRLDCLGVGVLALAFISYAMSFTTYHG